MSLQVSEFRQTPQWAVGRVGERAVCEWLKQRGWSVIRTADIAGENGEDKPPKLEGYPASYVVPDLDIARAGVRRWAEVKTKAAATFTRKTGRYEHGISLRHYRDYKRVQDITGCHVWIFIVEQEPQLLLADSLDKLDRVKREYDGPMMSRGGMVFWPRDAFQMRVPLSTLGCEC